MYKTFVRQRVRRGFRLLSTGALDALVADFAVRRYALHERTARNKDARRQRTGLRTAHTHDCNGALARRRRERGDRVARDQTGKTTTRLSGSAPSDSVRTCSLAASAR